MTTKLHINLTQGIIDIEGDPVLVREIYTDFKEQLIAQMRVGDERPSASADEDAPQSLEEGKPQRAKAKRAKSSKKRTPAPSGESNNNGVSADAPKLDKSLDTAKLQAFYGQFEAKNNPEKILIFLKFMNDELGIEDPNTDQFYTCYEKVNERIPKVFAQAFRDASGRKFGFIDYNSPTDIKITTVGTNHFKFDLKRKPAE